MIPQRLSIREKQPLQTREETMNEGPATLARTLHAFFTLPKASMISFRNARRHAVVYITHSSFWKHLLGGNNALVTLAVVLVTADFLVLPLLLVHESLELSVVVLRDGLGCHLDSAHATSSAD
jgi:hypothetical protein